MARPSKMGYALISTYLTGLDILLRMYLVFVETNPPCCFHFWLTTQISYILHKMELLCILIEISVSTPQYYTSKCSGSRKQNRDVS